MKKRLFTTKDTLIAALMLSLSLLGLPAAQANPLSGDYTGSVTLSSLGGLGGIDIAFHLAVDANGVMKPASSYVLLEKTLLFPKVAPQVAGRDVGPRVKRGYVDPVNKRFFLRTEPFSTVMFPNTSNQKEIVRQITLKSPVFWADGRITGIYVETISGYLPQPIRVEGTFAIAKP